MRKTSAGVFLTAAIISLIAWANPISAEAWSRPRERTARAEIRGGVAEIRRDRAELRSDVREYYRDREALQRAYRRGRSPAQIERLRNEVRQGRREILRDRREIRGDYAELRRDLDKYGYNNHRYGYGRPDYRETGWGWWNNDNRWDRRHDYNPRGSRDVDRRGYD
jgi:hypothetical protein